nr:hypothetical protein Itr_chr13CG20170 [Ipomoea trifida]
MAQSPETNPTAPGHCCGDAPKLQRSVRPHRSSDFAIEDPLQNCHLAYPNNSMAGELNHSDRS